MMFDGSLRHLGKAPVSAIQALLPSISEKVWQSNSFRQTAFKVHRQTRSLIFRHIPGDDPTDNYDLPIWSAWKDILQPTIRAMTQSYGAGRCCRIILANLPAGCTIPRHCDHGDAYALTHRIHVPIQTDPDVIFHLDGQDHYLESCKCYEINNLLEHGVINNSTIDRIHLIVDYMEDRPEFVPSQETKK